MPSGDPLEIPLSDLRAVARSIRPDREGWSGGGRRVFGSGWGGQFRGGDPGGEGSCRSAGSGSGQPLSRSWRGPARVPCGERAGDGGGGESPAHGAGGGTGG